VQGLDNQCWDRYHQLLPKVEEMTMIGSLYSELEDFLAECLADLEEDWQLIPYGSSVNGLMISGHSDLDLSLMIWSNDPNTNE
jgi:DNA polymerase sigma